MVTMSLLKWASKDQLDNWMPKLSGGQIAAFALTEPDVGSDINSISTKLSKRDGKWVLSGTKQWITFGAKADVFLVFAKYNQHAVACMVPKGCKGVRIMPLKDMLGFKACALANIDFDQVEIDENNIIGKPGFALSHIAPVGLHYGRISTSFSATGIIRACIEASTQRSVKRQVNGRQVNDFGMVKEMIADMGVNYEAAMQLCKTAAQAEESGSHEAINHALVAKYFASKSCVKAANDSVQIHGASGCHEHSSPTARYYRDSKIMEIIEGSTQVHQDLLNELWVKKYK
jgi:alkylation response protein AidB-like acyl-CoA dehydrogenase